MLGAVSRSLTLKVRDSQPQRRKTAVIAAAITAATALKITPPGRKTALGHKTADYHNYITANIKFQVSFMKSC